MSDFWKSNAETLPPERKLGEGAPLVVDRRRL